MEFPKNFLWGAASAAGQTEGHPLELGGGLSVWDAFCARPGSIQNGETDEVCTDFLHRFREDVGLLASLGLRAYRFSVSWARVDPRGTGEWSEEALRYYDELVDCCLAHGVEPFVTLHHWELPLALETRGGWLSRETPEAFARFAGMLAARLRGRVQHYFTLNEPECILGLGCETGAHAPGLKARDRGALRVLEKPAARAQPRPAGRPVGRPRRARRPRHHGPHLLPRAAGGRGRGPGRELPPQ
jgi:beta-glucosidase